MIKRQIFVGVAALLFMSGYKVDQLSPSMYEQLGDDKFRQISTNFYGRVYSEDVENKNSEFYDTFGRFFEGRPKGLPICYFFASIVLM